MDTFCPGCLWGLQEVCWGELLIDTWIVGYFLIFVPNIFCSNIPLNIIIPLISTISLSPIPHSESQSICNLIGINSREWDRVNKSAQYCCNRKYSETWCLERIPWLMDQHNNTHLFGRRKEHLFKKGRKKANK